MPPEDRVRCHDRHDRGEKPSAEHFPLRGEATALNVGQAQTAAAELLFENAILQDEVLDHLGLVPVEPAGEGGEEQLEWEEVGHHAGF